MSTFLLTLALLASDPTSRPGEDAAHRADRLRTEQLNRAAAARVTARQADDSRRNRAWGAKQSEYEQAMAAWRKREATRQRYNAGLR